MLEDSVSIYRPSCSTFFAILIVWRTDCNIHIWLGFGLSRALRFLSSNIKCNMWLWPVSLSLSSWDDWQADPHLQPYQTGRHHQGAHWDHLRSCCAVSLLPSSLHFQILLGDSLYSSITLLPFLTFFFFPRLPLYFSRFPLNRACLLNFSKCCHILWWLILLSDLICSSSPSAELRNWGVF